MKHINMHGRMWFVALGAAVTLSLLGCRKEHSGSNTGAGTSCKSFKDVQAIIQKELEGPSDAYSEAALKELSTLIPKLNLKGDKPPVLNVISVDVGIDSYKILMLAAVAGNADIVQFLLSKGADMTAKSREGHTALDLARRYGRTEVENVLMSQR